MTPRDPVVFLEPDEHGSGQRLAFATGPGRRSAAPAEATAGPEPGTVVVLDPDDKLRDGIRAWPPRIADGR